MAALAVENEYDIYVDGVKVEHPDSVMVDGVAYAAAFFVVQAMYPDAVATWENEQTCIRAEGLTITARPGEPYMVANGRYLYLPGKVQVHPETRNILLPVCELGEAMGAKVSYDAAGVYLTNAGTGPILSGDLFYNATDLDLIARVIRHEAGNQPLTGKLAVGNVILNRVASKQFPNNVYDVLYQKNQFPGATNSTANAACLIAAKLCMDGANVAPGACWFNGVGKACWASRNKSLVGVIGNHAFYG